MKLLKTAVPAAMMLAVLAACSSAAKEAQPAVAPKPEKTAVQASQPQVFPNALRVVRVDSIDGKTEVAYQCGEKGQDPLSVMYGFKDGQVVAAQVKYKNELTNNLWRVIDFGDRNMFTDGQVTWSAGLASPADVANTDGNMLTIKQVREVNGKQQQIDAVVTRYCKVAKPAVVPAESKSKKAKKK
ncbi:MAG: hypothetical protein Q4A49_05660 [Neisseria sp.]|nr:hypothetical protein [Neisseria sp.]